MQVITSIFAEQGNAQVNSYLLDNGRMQVRVLNYGAVVQSLILGSGQQQRNVVLNYGNMPGYVNDTYYVGVVVGRVANRIEDAVFELNGKRVQLSMNEPALRNHIHGGVEGFGKKLFSVFNTSCDDEKASVSMIYDSIDGEEGYPGHLRTTVTYTLSSSNELIVDFEAKCNADTHVNLTQHTYFNLNGVGAGTKSNDHYLQINAEKYLPVNQRFLPAGLPLPVEGTRYDFTTPAKIVDRREDVDAPIYNTWFQLGDKKEVAATLESEDRMVKMHVSTSYPGLLLYSGDYLAYPFEKYEGVCLECQFPPNAPNLSGLPATLLRVGQEYRHFIKYHFDWKL